MGFTEGRDFAIEISFAGGHYDRLPALATELIRKPVAVISPLTGAGAPAQAAKADDDDPDRVPERRLIRSRMAWSQARNRPGGNVTGATRQSIELGPKRLVCRTT